MEPEFKNTEDRIALTLTEAELRRVELATAEVPYLPSDAGSVFELLWSGFTGGHLEGDSGVQSVLALCGRALRSAAEKEGEAVSVPDRRLREAMGERASGKLNARDRAGMEALLEREGKK
jgi:hypothetical protein